MGTIRQEIKKLEDKIQSMKNFVEDGNNGLSYDDEVNIDRRDSQLYRIYYINKNTGDKMVATV